jgi:dipicolinate synthase subunit B
MDLNGKKVGFAVCASFCTIPDIIEPLKRLKEAGADIYPIVSENVFNFSSRFHDKDEFLDFLRGISGKEVVSTIEAAEKFGPDIKLDIMVIAPITGNTAAKLAHGITDGPVLMATKATLRNKKPVLLALFSNDALAANGMNIMKLYNTKNIFFVPFGQDDPYKKPTSLTANLDKLNESIQAALLGEQIQPAIL